MSNAFNPEECDARCGDSPRQPRAPFREPMHWRWGGHTYWDYHQIPRPLWTAIVKAYRHIFGEAPWNEDWSERGIMLKYIRELAVPDVSACNEDTSFLTVIDGDDDYPVAGFCSGALVDTATIPGRVLSAHPVDVTMLKRLTDAVHQIAAPRVVYTDEIGLIDRFRHRGVLPVAQLCYPVTVLGTEYDVGAVCWSTTRSRMVPILRHYYYDVIAEVGDVLFLYSPPEGVAATHDTIFDILSHVEVARVVSGSRIVSSNSSVQ
jgi:hypothetical protein